MIVTYHVFLPFVFGNCDWSKVATSMSRVLGSILCEIIGHGDFRIYKTGEVCFTLFSPILDINIDRNMCILINNEMNRKYAWIKDNIDEVDFMYDMTLSPNDKWNGKFACMIRFDIDKNGFLSSFH